MAEIKYKDILPEGVEKVTIKGEEFIEMYGIFIEDPFYDNTGRFEVDPKEYYGILNPEVYEEAWQEI